MPLPKQAAYLDADQLLTYFGEWQIFCILGQLRSTAADLDQLPASRLRLGASIFSKPLADLLNKSPATFTVPGQ
jgi:hypothetical protein